MQNSLRFIPSTNSTCSKKKSDNEIALIVGGFNHDQVDVCDICQIIDSFDSATNKNNNKNNKENNETSKKYNESYVFKSFKDDYNKNNSCLINLGELTYCLVLIKSNRLLYVFNGVTGKANVYDIDKDEWQCKDPGHNKQFNKLGGVKREDGISILSLNDEIVIVLNANDRKTMYFIDISNENVYEPEIFEVKVLINDKDINAIAMCCIEYDYRYNSNSNNKSKECKLKILLFGCREKNIIDSLASYNICINWNDIKNTWNVSSFIKNKINGNDITIVNDDENNNNNLNKINLIKQLNKCRLYDFGYQCIFNLKNESIIIIIGGTNANNDQNDDNDDNDDRIEWGKSIILFNVTRKELKLKQNVKCLFSYINIIIFNFYYIFVTFTYSCILPVCCVFYNV